MGSSKPISFQKSMELAAEQFPEFDIAEALGGYVAGLRGSPVFATQTPEAMRARLEEWQRTRPKAALENVPETELEKALPALRAAINLNFLPGETRDVLYLLWLEISKFMIDGQTS
jgi:hypothetical protein